GELILREGGFLPFGARVGASDMQFVQLAPEGEESIESLYGRLVDMLALEAQRGEIAGSAIVVDARIADEEDDAGVIVLVETTGFCRSVLARYKKADSSIEFGPLT